jgi:hypothetical protein
MSGYRLYYLGVDRRIFGADEFRAETDEVALAQAKRLASRMKPYAWELWTGSRRVHLEAPSGPTPSALRSRDRATVEGVHRN